MLWFCYRILVSWTIFLTLSIMPFRYGCLPSKTCERISFHMFQQVIRVVCHLISLFIRVPVCSLIFFIIHSFIDWHPSRASVRPSSYSHTCFTQSPPISSVLLSLFWCTWDTLHGPAYLFSPALPVLLLHWRVIPCKDSDFRQCFGFPDRLPQVHFRAISIPHDICSILPLPVLVGGDKSTWLSPFLVAHMDISAHPISRSMGWELQVRVGCLLV